MKITQEVEQPAPFIVEPPDSVVRDMSGSKGIENSTGHRPTMNGETGTLMVIRLPYFNPPNW